MRNCTKTEEDSSSSSSESSSVQVTGTFLVKRASFKKSKSPDTKKQSIEETISPNKLSKEGPLYKNLPSSSNSTSKPFKKGDIICLKQPEWLRGEVINTSIKKLERVSPYRGERLSINSSVWGFDDNNKGKKGEDRKTTLLKHLTTDCSSNVKSISRFMIGVNPSDKHCHGVVIDTENNKRYSHCSLGTASSNIKIIVKGFKDTEILKSKRDEMDLSVDLYST
eukprot:2898660-Ditylum_brightwellii.AAC.1